MLCKELLGSGRTPARVNIDRYYLLHHEGRGLISSWFDRAWEARGCQGGDCFEAFIFAWFAVNGWAACVTEIDRDRDYLDALMADRTIETKFEQLMHDPTSQFAKYAGDFAQVWPIFEVKELRQKGMLWLHRDSRNQLINEYLSGGAGKFQPQCWKRHFDADQQIPVDWPHTLAALYRVRCNLFHGEKAAHSEMDQLVVSSAFQVLIRFFRESGYL